MQPAKGHYTENLKAQINNWCKVARGVKAKRHKTQGHRKRSEYIVNIVSQRTLLNLI
jgi:hypothetical protein